MLTENGRVDAMVSALRSADLEEAGRLLDASHASLRDDYEASVPEVERTVERAQDAPARRARGWSAAASAARCSRYCAPGVAAPAGALVVAPGRPAGLV